MKVAPCQALTLSRQDSAQFACSQGSIVEVKAVPVFSRGETMIENTQVQREPTYADACNTACE